MSETQQAAAVSGNVLRHKGLDRGLHWLFAVSVLVLLATGFLPILGIKFEWVTVHWVTGIVLLALLLLHVVRSVQGGQFGTVWFGADDLGLVIGRLRKTQAKPGKYSPEQKLMHLGVSVLVLMTLVTGLLMMVKIDTPFWERNIYLLEDATWGIIYVLHGFAALCLITTVMLHIYFALRPEKRMYLRSMFSGNMTRGEVESHHDVNKWVVDK